ncbi:MAG: PDZ domain-containing protein, partial [Myxococcales bacterium]|nr:PDZ domain-containing protein [Myxococcales bacterium]
MLPLLLIGLAGASGLSDRAYERAIDLVDGLYLYPEQLDANVLLRSAAEGLADELHWLRVKSQGPAVNLEHGDGTLIGSVSVANLDTLPAALLALEDLVTHAGHPLGDTDVRLVALQGLTRGLDRYSRVLSGDGLDRFDVRLKGTLVGIGIGIHILDDQLRIYRVDEGGPAALAGVQVGDVITRIDGRSTTNMPTREATRLLRGKEGSEVVLAVLRAGSPVELKVSRAEIVVPNVESEVLEGDVAVVRISHMSQRTVENLVAELARMEAQGALAHGLVVDLRQNTGGSMKESARTVDEFVDAGMLLRTAGHDGGQVRNLQARMDAEPGGHVPDVPVAILVDDRTASGAEILAGALLELDRAVLVGTRTYGKGTVQKIYPLGEDVRLKLTVAQYILENERRIADGGLLPDAVVGSITLDSYGVHYQGWDPGGLPREAILPWVREGWGWRKQDVPEVDLAQELARRAVLAAEGPGRPALLASLKARA